MTCSRLDQCNLISPTPTLCATAVAIICRLSLIPLCLPVTLARTAAPLELSHPTQVEQLLPATPDNMACRHQMLLLICASIPPSASNDEENNVEDRRGTAKSAKKSFTHAIGNLWRVKYWVGPFNSWAPPQNIGGPRPNRPPPWSTPLVAASAVTGSFKQVCKTTDKQLFHSTASNTGRDHILHHLLPQSEACELESASAYAKPTSSSAIAERSHCSYGQKWKIGTGRQYLWTL